MIIKTVHVKERRDQKLFEVYPGQKEYSFRVDKKIENDIKEGMIVRFSKNQLLYVVEVITDCEDEKQYTGKVRKIVKLKRRKIVFLSEEELVARQEDLAIKQKKQLNIDNHTKKITVIKGTYLIINNKRFKRLKRTVKLEVGKVVQKWVKVGDILYTHEVNKKGNDVYRYVIVQEITEGVPITRSKSDCKVVEHYYEKMEKGYKKRLLNNNGFVIIPKKKKVVKTPTPKKKKPKESVATNKPAAKPISKPNPKKMEIPLSRRKEAEKAWEETVKKEFTNPHPFTMRKTKDTDKKE